MADEWMVRVQDREYGPVDSETLEEWKREGRLIPTNELRRVEDERWAPAAEFPEFFADNVAEDAPPDLVVRRRNWSEIYRETIRIYRGGFWRFMVFGLLTAVPMFVMQWNFPRIATPDLLAGATMPAVTIPPICWIMFLLVVLLWPISTAGFQYVADDVLQGRSRSLASQFTAAIERYGRMLGTGLLVYFAYFFWFFIPLTAMVALLSAGFSFFSVLLYLVIGVFMVYMNARLFINFLFWEQTAAFGQESVFFAIRESKELARCAPQAPRLEQPLYRGAIVASFWLLLLLAAVMAIQFPFTLIRLRGIENPEQAMALMQTLSQSQTPDPLMIAADVAAAVVNLILRPLLAASFIVLYYDAKARLGR